MSPLLPCPSRQAIGDAVEPATHRLAFSDRAGFSSEKQKRCLEDVLRILFLPQEAPGQAQHHGSMALQEKGERALLPLRDKPFEQCRVACLGHRLDCDQPVDVLQYRARHLLVVLNEAVPL
jgi:hypothetical protein